MAMICARFIVRTCMAVIAVLLLAGAMPALAEGPKFKVDPFWPKPLPNNWIIGQVGGMSIDAQDNIWVFQRPRSLTPDEKGAALKPPRSKCCVPAPSVLVFNQAGDVVKAWGGPGDNQGYDWPAQEHSILVDNKGFVWLSGNGKDDSMVLKFTTDGKFVKELGRRGPLTSSTDLTQFGQIAGNLSQASQPLTQGVQQVVQQVQGLASGVGSSPAQLASDTKTDDESASEKAQLVDDKGQPLAEGAAAGDQASGSVPVEPTPGQPATAPSETVV